MNAYRTFRLLVTFDAQVIRQPRMFEIVAVSKDAALADIVSAYGECTLIQWSAL